MVVQNGRGHQVSAIVLLKGSNYPTRKLQCRMVLMREGLWSIVSGTEQAPPNDEAENITKFGHLDHRIGTAVKAQWTEQ